MALCKISDSYRRTIHRLNYEFVSRERILEINTIHLNHNYETDIITFDYCEKDRVIGEMFMCLDVILDNAVEIKVDSEVEVKRVVFHGLLHLLGFKDKSLNEMNIMREKEEECLKLIAGVHE